MEKAEAVEVLQRIIAEVEEYHEAIAKKYADKIAELPDARAAQAAAVIIRYPEYEALKLAFDALKKS